MVGDLVLSLRAAARVSVRRVRRGPAQPNWSVGYEMLQEVVQGMFNRHLPLAQGRAAFDDFSRLVPGPKGVRIEATQLGGRPAEWHIPEGLASDAPVLLYLHGGIYEIGSPRSHRPLTLALAHRAGARIASLDYRLAPEDPCPAAIDDAVAAWRELIASGVAPERAFIGGDSAGGGLTTATLCALRDAGDPLPAGAILLSPWVDLSTSHPDAPTDYIRTDLLDEKVAQYAGALPPTDPRVSPLFADLTGLPPLLVLAGGAETLLPDAERFAQAARAAGVQVTLDVEPGEVHVYAFFSAVNPRARAALDRIAAALHAWAA